MIPLLAIIAICYCAREHSRVARVTCNLLIAAIAIKLALLVLP